MCVCADTGDEHHNCGGVFCLVGEGAECVGDGGEEGVWVEVRDECLCFVEEGLLFCLPLSDDAVGGVLLVFLGVCKVSFELVVECFEIEGVGAVVLYE